MVSSCYGPMGPRERADMLTGTGTFPRSQSEPKTLNRSPTITPPTLSSKKAVKRGKNRISQRPPVKTIRIPFKNPEGLLHRSLRQLQSSASMSFLLSPPVSCLLRLAHGSSIISDINSPGPRKDWSRITILRYFSWPLNYVLCPILSRWFKRVHYIYSEVWPQTLTPSLLRHLQLSATSAPVWSN